MTGGQASFGQAADSGIRLAIDETNAAGGIKGRTIHVITEDDQSKPEEAVTAVTKLIASGHVVAMLGEAASSNSLAAAPVCQANKIPMITPISTNPEVTKKGDYIFRICFIDPYQGEALARYIHDQLHLSRAAILIDVKSDYSTGLSQFFERTFTELGGKIVSKMCYSSGDFDFRPGLTAIRAARPDIIFLPGYYTEVGQIISQARDLGIQQPFAGGDGWESPKLFEIGGKALNGCFYSNHYYVHDPSPAVQGFVSKYQKKYGTPPDAFAALAYDAAKVLTAAMARAQRLDGPSIRDEIARTKGVAGVTGTITLGPDRNPVGKRLVVLEILNGGVQIKGVVDPALNSPR
jgi:branched-chain amino acid transport system substrate-binding protein